MDDEKGEFVCWHKKSGLDEEVSTLNFWGIARFAKQQNGQISYNSKKRKPEIVKKKEKHRYPERLVHYT